MAGGWNFLGAGRAGVQMEWEEVAVGIFGVGLVEDGFAVGEREGIGIAEAADAGHGSKVVVEGAVFLHENHDVLNVARGSRGGGGSRASRARRTLRGQNGGGEVGEGGEAGGWSLRRRRRVMGSGPGVREDFSFFMGDF